MLPGPSFRHRIVVTNGHPRYRRPAAECDRPRLMSAKGEQRVAQCAIFLRPIIFLTKDDLMNKPTLLCLAIGLACPQFAVPAIAQEADEIVVLSSQAAFAEDVGRQLDHNLARLDYPVNFSGIVRISFVTSEDGAVEDIELFAGSGNFRLDRNALEATRRLHKLNSSSLGGVSGQRVLATIIFAENSRVARKLSQAASAETSEMAAAGQLAPYTVALTVTPTVG